MSLRPPRSTPTATLFPYTTLFRSCRSTTHSAADWSSAGKDNRMSAEAGPCSRICPVSRRARHERKRGRSYALALRAWPSRSTDGMSDADPSTQQIISVELDEGSIVWRNPDVEQERRGAIFDLKIGRAHV